MLLQFPIFCRPFHSVLLGLFFNFQIATNPCAHTDTIRHAHTPLSPLTTISQSETQELLGTHSHTDTWQWDTGKWKQNSCNITWVSHSRTVIVHRGRTVCVCLCECMILCGPACMWCCIDITLGGRRRKTLCFFACVCRREKEILH